jgi:hypothetical protein
MKCRIHLAGLTAVIALLVAGDLLACGDKFLVAGRGTRYQRPKNARAASIVIYANPLSGSPRMQSLLQRQGHHAVTVTTFDQLTAVLSGGRFDVVLAARDVAGKIQQLFAGAPDAAVVVGFDAAPKATTLLKAIDKAVEQRDHDLRKNRNLS